jgi:hypothetical protein
LIKFKVKKEGGAFWPWAKVTPKWGNNRPWLLRPATQPSFQTKTAINLNICANTTNFVNNRFGLFPTPTRLAAKAEVNARV